MQCFPNLGDLPAQVLTSILRHSKTPLILRIWSTGNRFFNSKLANAITEIELRPIPGVEFRVPAMLHDLPNLRHIRLYSPGNMVEDPTRWRSLLQALPILFVVSLEIESLDAHACFNNYAPDATANSTPIRKELERGSSYRFNIEEVLPMLKTLKLVCPCQFMDVNLFPALPSNLTSFSLSCPFLLPIESLNMLPPSLKVLDVAFRAGMTASDFKSNSPWTLANLPRVPHSMIRRLVCQDESGPWPISALSEEVVNLAKWPTLLPQGLQSLHIEFRFACSPTFIAKLPRTLLDLRLGAMVSDSWTKFFDNFQSAHSESSIWPPTLTALGIQLKSIKKGVLQAFPRSIHRLKLAVAEHDNNRTLFASELPPGLTSLKVSLKKIYSVEGDFPQSLTEWYSYGAHSVKRMLPTNFMDWPSYAAHGLDCNGLAKLPPSVSNLSLVGNLTEEYRSYHLPSNFKSLYVDIWRSSFASLAPTGLTSLTIFRFDFPDVKNVFDFLPPSLTKLRIESTVMNVHLPETCLDHLTQLIDLHICPRFGLPSAALKHIGSRAIMQRLSVELFLGDAEDLAFLPPNLITCHLGPCFDYSLSQVAKYWPRYAIWRPPNDDHVAEMSNFIAEVQVMTPSTLMY